LNKILYLPTRYYPAISGAEFYLQRMAEILTSNYDYGVDIFTSNAIDFKALKDPIGKTIERNDKSFHYVNQLKINRFYINYNLSIDAKIEKVKEISSYKSLNLSDECLKEALKNGPYLDDLIEHMLKHNNFNYDLIHSTFFPYFNLIIALLIGNLIKKPVLCTPFFHYSNPRYMNSLQTEILKKFDSIIACTNLEKKYLNENIGISKRKIRVIPMGVDYKRFGIESKKKDKPYNFKEKFFKNDEKKFKMVLFCGHKNYEKGALSILRAIPYILEKFRKVYFVFIGPSTMAFNRELSKIQKLTNTRILNFTPDNLTGYFDKKKIAAFKESDLYLMPSRSDAYGITFLEAWAAKKPVIGANIGASPEVIRNNIDGILVQFDNHKEIAEKVIYLLKNKKLRRKMGAIGNLKVVEKHSWETVAKETHELYQELIGKLRG